jgi:hypothetical protein
LLLQHELPGSNEIKEKSNEMLPGKSKETKEVKDVARGGKREGAGRRKGSTGGVRLPSVRPDIKQELRELAREHTDTALGTLVRICKMSDSDTARVAAASALLDRGYGKPGQQTNLDITHYDRMDEHQLRERIAEQLHTIRLLDGNGTEH